MALYEGTSGFAYPEWKGTFYPPDLKQADMLPFYAGRFPTVEINYTFRRFPEETTLRRWAGHAPEGFRFAMKANQRITHTRRLRNAEADVAEFLRLARLLGDHLGPILFQCPPTLPYDRELLERFLALLTPTAPYAFEFRHDSWGEARPLLAEHGVAWCLAESDEKPVDRWALPDGPFVYLRLRKEEYSDDALREWATSLGTEVESGREVYAFFKHEDGARAPSFARRLAELIRLGSGQR